MASGDKTLAARTTKPVSASPDWPRLFAALALARGDGRYTRMLRAIARLDLLILDDWGPEPLDADQRRDLFENWNAWPASSEPALLLRPE